MSTDEERPAETEGGRWRVFRLYVVPSLAALASLMIVLLYGQQFLAGFSGASFTVSVRTGPFVLPGPVVEAPARVLDVMAATVDDSFEGMIAAEREFRKGPPGVAGESPDGHAEVVGPTLIMLRSARPVLASQFDEAADTAREAVRQNPGSRRNPGTFISLHIRNDGDMPSDTLSVQFRSDLGFYYEVLVGGAVAASGNAADRIAVEGGLEQKEAVTIDVWTRSGVGPGEFVDIIPGGGSSQRVELVDTEMRDHLKEQVRQPYLFSQVSIVAVLLLGAVLYWGKYGSRKSGRSERPQSDRRA